jgi:ribosomal protein L44E
MSVADRLAGLSPEQRALFEKLREKQRKAAARPPQPPPVPSGPSKSPARPDALRLKCAACQTPMRVPLKVLAGKAELPVKCPNAECGKIIRLKKSARPAAKAAGAPRPKEENVNYDD